MKFKSDFFAESKPIAGYTWVQDNCTVNIINEAQRIFLDSEEGIALMDRLFDAKNEEEYREIAQRLEDLLETRAPSSSPSNR